MAKDSKATVKDGDPFAGTLEKRPPAKLFFYAVRQIRGPVKHEGYEVFKAHDEADAKRQWFNSKAQAQRSHAYDLQVVKLDPNHPACKQAKSVAHPINEVGMSIQQMMDADFSAVQQGIAQGPQPPIKQSATSGK